MKFLLEIFRNHFPDREMHFRVTWNNFITQNKTKKVMSAIYRVFFFFFWISFWVLWIHFERENFKLSFVTGKQTVIYILNSFETGESRPSLNVLNLRHFPAFKNNTDRLMGFWRFIFFYFFFPQFAFKYLLRLICIAFWICVGTKLSNSNINH